MGSRGERALAKNRNVNPEVEGTYHLHTRERRSENPDHTDGVQKDGTGKQLVQFVDHDNGFLKVRRALDSSDLHLTWTWSVGPHAGRYVYVRVLAWQTAYGLELLYGKLTEVEAGERRATPDKLGHYR